MSVRDDITYETVFATATYQREEEHAQCDSNVVGLPLTQTLSLLIDNQVILPA